MKEIVPNQPSTIDIAGNTFEIIKAARLRDGMVLKRNNIYGRLGQVEATKAEQIHTEALFNRGFPVPKVLESGETNDNRWFFTESSLGDEPFHVKFKNEYDRFGKISDETFGKYLDVVEKYTRAQTNENNRSSISSDEFVNSLFTENHVEWNYTYFAYDEKEYRRAIKKACDRLVLAPMGILQHDLNPYNMLEGGVIDFELYGFGAIGYDTLTSVRWGGGWFTDYPSRYPVAYKLSPKQVAENDSLVDRIALEAGVEAPSHYIEEFLLLKTAWSVSDFQGIDPNWAKDKIAFRQFRAKLLNSAVESYLADEPIDYWSFSSTI